MSKTVKKEAQMTKIHLLSVPNIYGNLTLNNLKNKKFISSIIGQPQSFSLLRQYNNYQVVLNKDEKESAYYPFLGVLYKDNLYFKGDLLWKRKSLSDLSDTYIDSLISNSKLSLKTTSSGEWDNYEYELIVGNISDNSKSLNFDLDYLKIL